MLGEPNPEPEPEPIGDTLRRQYPAPVLLSESNGRCYTCGEIGHKSGWQGCRGGRGTMAMPAAAIMQDPTVPAPTVSLSVGSFSGRCFECGEDGHMASWPGCQGRETVPLAPCHGSKCIRARRGRRGGAVVTCSHHVIVVAPRCQYEYSSYMYQRRSTRSIDVGVNRVGKDSLK